MPDATHDTEQAAHLLLQSPEAKLYEELGIRAKALGADFTLAGSLTPQVAYEQSTMGLKDDVRDFGKRLFERLQKELYGLVCGSLEKDTADRAKLLDAIGVSEVAFASALTGFIVLHLGIAPALAPILAAIVVKRFFRPAYEEFCQTWKSRQ
jgi:hypothetical protein